MRNKKDTVSYTHLAWICGNAERAYVKYLNGGCSSPVAAYAEIEEDEIFIRGLYYSEEKKTFLTGSIRGEKEEGETLGVTLAKQLRDAVEKGGARCV